MKGVNVAELKGNLSKYLLRVRKGERLLVLNRKEPIAEIVPVGPEKLEDPHERMIREGKAYPATRKWGDVTVAPLKRPLTVQECNEVLDWVREDGD